MTVSRAIIAIGINIVIGCFAQAWLMTAPNAARAQNSDAPRPAGDPVRGEKIALSCGTCHGDAGMSNAAWIPSLAGMNEDAIYKQLADYRSHRRRPEWYMASIAEALSLQDLADVSTYYARQAPGFATRAPNRDSPAAASCRSCHNAQSKDAAEIAGQQTQYLEIQLSLFAQGIRTNDRNEQMRKIARELTIDQIRQISESLGAKTR
ncbi:MAG TPA: hypothetical protein VND65_02990 [Candidatus Binatia bacterium]|nr:hypothetical protein [Candidatus Binatia bacterium]